MLTQEKTRFIIKKLKKEYGFTYTYIAELIGISKSHLSLFLDEKRDLNRNKIEKFERILKTKFEGSFTMNV